MRINQERAHSSPLRREDPSPTGVDDASSRQVEDVVKLNLETLEIEGYARSEGSIAGEVVAR